MRCKIHIVTATAVVAVLSCSDDDQVLGPLTIPEPPAAVCTPIAEVDVSNARVVGDGTPGSITEAAIRTAIEQGDTIRCDGGDTPPTIAVSRPFEVRKHTVLDGGGIVFDGGGRTRLFLKKCVGGSQAAGVSLTLQNMTLANGRTDTTGAAIRNETFGQFTAINVSFLHNTCAITADHDIGGGAIYSVMQTDIILSGCTFVGNTGANGGAIGGVGNSMRLFNCVFDSNTATGHGGGKEVGPTGLGGIGGAIYIDNVHINRINNFLEICGCVFRHNRGNALGGAIFIWFGPNQQSVGEINLCTFENNWEQASAGGAVYQQNGTFTIANSTFTRNRAVKGGGALRVHRDDSDANLPIYITNCTFEGNTLTHEKGLGGAINNTKSIMPITNCTFANNATRFFACAIFNQGTMTLTNALFANNVFIPDTNNNGWAGVAINKTELTDGGGNLCYPATFDKWGADYWLEQNPGVLREDPLVEPLADNGGPTKTMAIPAQSPAVDQGTGSGCPGTDQRGYARVGTCDIGAYEYGAGQ